MRNHIRLPPCQTTSRIYLVQKAHYGLGFAGNVLTIPIVANMRLILARPKLLRGSEVTVLLVGGKSFEDDEDEMIDEIHLDRKVSLRCLACKSKFMRWAYLKIKIRG